VSSLVETACFRAVLEQASPPADTVRHFSSVTAHADASPVVVRLHSCGADPWVGLFNRDQERNDDRDALYPTGDECVLAIVAGRLGYLVNVLDPDRWLAVPLSLVDGAMYIAEPGIVVFWDFVQLTAYKGTKSLWSTAQVSYDGLRNLRVVGGDIQGEAWSAPGHAWCEFIVDLRTGEVSGGATPPRLM
jgi:hypothetical protein